MIDPATALLLVDLQHDFLERAGLTPAPGAVCAAAAALLRAFRAAGLPVGHAHTRVRADGSNRMPHWTRLGIRQCVEGTRGAESPPDVAPRAAEPLFTKTHYSAFADPRLDAWLRERGVTRLVLAGLYLEACVRSTALDAYARGYEVSIADGAVGTLDPLHAEATRAWVEARVASFRSAAALADAVAGERRARPTRALPVAVIAGAALPASDRHEIHLHRDPRDGATLLAAVPLGGREEVEAAARAATEAAREWGRRDASARAALVERFAERLESRREALAALLVTEIAKPRRFAEEEIGRAVAHARIAAELARSQKDLVVAPGVRAVSRPLGVVGLITPWNNPVAIPVGKIAPALALGNAVVWKPSPRAPRSALALLDCVAHAGLPAGLVDAVFGAEATARAVAADPRVAAVSVTGSIETGRSLAAVCARGPKPLQAELGGNNAAIVLADADLERTAGDLARAAFVFGGQRCTAVRRIVVVRAIAERFESLLAAATASLEIGDPAAEATDVGPLVSIEHRDGVRAAIDRALASGARLVTGGSVPRDRGSGAWLLPALLADAAPRSPIVQEETFGPVAVVQIAADLDDALALANGVAQGLVVAVATADERARARVLEAAEAGIVQLAPGPLPVHPRAPFSGWKSSGLGPPEHGIWDAAFYTRLQAVYGDSSC